MTAEKQTVFYSRSPSAPTMGASRFLAISTLPNISTPSPQYYLLPMFLLSPKERVKQMSWVPLKLPELMKLLLMEIVMKSEYDGFENQQAKSISEFNGRLFFKAQ